MNSCLKDLMPQTRCFSHQMAKNVFQLLLLPLVEVEEFAWVKLLPRLILKWLGLTYRNISTLNY